MAFSSRGGGLCLPRQAWRHCKTALFSQPAACARLRYSSAAPKDSEQDTTLEDPFAAMERWRHTPEKMKAPYSLTPEAKVHERTIWKVNESPQRLSSKLTALLGPSAPDLLTDELKWLAVTHKSFDQGRRGFNTRLAHFGRHVMVLEATTYIMTSPNLQQSPSPESDEHADVADTPRRPFAHPALAAVDRLTQYQPQDLISQEKMVRFAKLRGLHEVVRWKPRNPQNVAASGEAGVLQGAIYALLGAISLQNGAEVARKICRERILKYLVKDIYRPTAH